MNDRGKMTLDLDEQRLRLWQAIQAITIGNKHDDKLIVTELHKAGYCIAPLKDHVAPRDVSVTDDVPHYTDANGNKCYTREDIAASLPVANAQGHVGVREGWEYRIKGPAEGGDQRCLCTIETDGMVYVGIAIYTANFKKWFQNGTPLTGRVLAWKPLPEPAKGRWAHGQLCNANDAAAPAYDDGGK